MKSPHCRVMLIFFISVSQCWNNLRSWKADEKLTMLWNFWFCWQISVLNFDLSGRKFSIIIPYVWLYQRYLQTITKNGYLRTKHSRTLSNTCLSANTSASIVTYIHTIDQNVNIRAAKILRVRYDVTLWCESQNPRFNLPRWSFWTKSALRPLASIFLAALFQFYKREIP